MGNEFMTLTFNWKSVDVTELENNLQKLVMDLDKDQSGDVDERELSSVFQGVLSPHEVHEVFERIDENHDGVLTLEELKRFLFEPVTEEEIKKYPRRTTRSVQSQPSALHTPEFWGGKVAPAATVS